MKISNLDFYNITMNDVGEIEIKYDSISYFKKEKTNCPLRDYLLKEIEVDENINFTQHQLTTIFQDHLNIILEDKEKIQELMEVLDEE